MHDAAIAMHNFAGETIGSTAAQGDQDRPERSGSPAPAGA
jgi:hypothetical protein